MPKNKTNKGAEKRLKVTANGKIKYGKAGGRHLTGAKSRKRKRNLRRGGVLSAPETKRVIGMLGK